MDSQPEIDRLIAEHGGILERSKNHRVFKFPNGFTYIEAKTPSDWRAEKNNLQKLRRGLGLIDPDRGKEGERREKRLATDHRRQNPARGLGHPSGLAHTMGEQLSAIGLRTSEQVKHDETIEALLEWGERATTVIREMAEFIERMGMAGL